MELSEHQLKLLATLDKHYPLEIQLAGYGQAKWLSVARALKRRGLAHSWKTGYYSVTDVGHKMMQDAQSGNKQGTLDRKD